MKNRCINNRSFYMPRKLALGLVILLSVLSATPSWSAPGILQLASRGGFWANDFPDTAIFLQHYYAYRADRVWDASGNRADIQTLHLNASFSRVVRPWHFGAQDQFQYILEGIIPLYNISGEEDGSQPAFVKSGLGHPLVYSSLGWNNPDKTTHLQGALIWQLPLGDNELMQAIGGGDNHAVMPLVAIEQRLGNLWFDGSLGYWYNFDDLATKEKLRDYFEVNGALSYRFSTPRAWWAYVQSDYTQYQEGKDAAGNGLNNDGFNWALAPGLGVAIRPNMTLDLKYAIDVEGESTLSGSGLNLRLLWVF